MEKKLINLTPHAITLVRPYGGEDDLVIPSTGLVARCATVRTEAAGIAVNGRIVSVDSVEFGEVTGLPDADREPGAVYIVSALVAQHPSVRGRADVFSPGELVRGPGGQPVGCKGLTRA